MLWLIFIVLLIFWGVGFAIDLAGGLIHILLVFALIALIFNLVRGRRGV
ncbi:lmo0937 family membrane protein [Paenibacillus sp. 598K]|nr:lmo0937 family membrane protein [Paenibacillus sp. 598K]